MDNAVYCFLMWLEILPVFLPVIWKLLGIETSASVSSLRNDLEMQRERNYKSLGLCQRTALAWMLKICTQLYKYTVHGFCKPVRSEYDDALVGLLSILQSIYSNNQKQCGREISWARCFWLLTLSVLTRNLTWKENSRTSFMKDGISWTLGTFSTKEKRGWGGNTTPFGCCQNAFSHFLVHISASNTTSTGVQYVRSADELDERLSWQLSLLSPVYFNIVDSRQASSQYGKG